MLASCWDWNSLKYTYYLIDGVVFDAGGWSPSKGIVAKDSKQDDNTVCCLEDCLPDLPKNSYFVGSGDFLLGELFNLTDKEVRKTLDLNRMYASGRPAEMKIVEIIRDAQTSSGLARTNPVPKVGDPQSQDSTNTQVDHANIYKSPPTVWDKILPLVMGAGIGYTVYSFSTGSLKLKDVLLIWSAGLAVGISIGEESARQQLVKR